MTRLCEADICDIRNNLFEYDKILKRKIGANLSEIAAYAVNMDLKILRKKFIKEKIAVIPITTGLGIIKGFSETVCSIINFLGIESFVTNKSDVAGIGEAINRGATQLFIADDDTCSLINLRQNIVADNSICTGMGFAAALTYKLKSVNKKTVVVLGAGPVGRSATKFLVEHGADVILYDIDEEKSNLLKNEEHVKIVSNITQALKENNIYFEATTALNVIKDEYIDENTIIAAPGIPLGISKKVFDNYKDNVIHDALEIGVASMVFFALRR
ncbi:3-methylornithyl-N6-L-lysine dehydrogenase PylD [Megamonas funiformis]|uniref:3-methylornithyl-N6-L-lysine dehydrogenase PylD n=1 Tax=Megamonas funiformis TaxID=437897 RepID=UPI00143062C1|nr:3-methylornithyl-N6-L-lysine dehydrogenase PylD [Megamonas funiformis]NJE28359.1 3-methylornithyl-N6-L-lysine dehydrogenase PylD [Megamonas funiformis]